MNEFFIGRVVTDPGDTTTDSIAQSFFDPEIGERARFARDRNALFRTSRPYSPFIHNGEWYVTTFIIAAFEDNDAVDFALRFDAQPYEPTF